MNIPVFVINLKRCPERRNHTAQQLNDFGISFQVIDAIDGNDLSDNEIKTKFGKGIFKHRYLRKAEIGCILSHLKIYQKMLDEGIEIACILEDDNDYKKDLKELLNYENLNVVGWELLLLGHGSQFHHSMNHGAISKKVYKNYEIGKPIERPSGTYAYIIKKPAAIKLLNHAYPLRMPADQLTGNAAALGVKLYVLTPPCAINNPILFESTIKDDVEIEYTHIFMDFSRRLQRNLAKRFPFLRIIKRWIRILIKFPILTIRKFGILEDSYAKRF